MLWLVKVRQAVRGEFSIDGAVVHHDTTNEISAGINDSIFFRIELKQFLAYAKMF